MPKQLRLDGSADLPSDEAPLKRNADGSMPAEHVKAVSWYAITYGLKLTASSAWPSMSFIDQAGQPTVVPLEDVLKEYDDWRKKTHGKQTAA